jgi:hypothetical protein
MGLRATDQYKVLFDDPHIFDYLRNMWSLRSLAGCLKDDELGIPISFKCTRARNLN